MAPTFDALDLTEQGRQQIIRQRHPDELFVASEVSWDLLHSGGTAFTLLSTPDLINRIRRPTTGTPLLRAQLLHLHSRFTRPVLNIIGVFLAIPSGGPSRVSEPGGERHALYDRSCQSLWDSRRSFSTSERRP